jgi:hypothetical protein
MATAGLMTGIIRFADRGDWWNLPAVVIGTALGYWWAVPAWRLARRRQGPGQSVAPEPPSSCAAGPDQVMPGLPEQRPRWNQDAGG